MNNTIAPSCPNSIRDAIIMATSHGIKCWCLTKSKTEWIVFCRRPDGAVFLFETNITPTHMMALIKTDKNHFPHRNVYVGWWSLFVSEGWTNA